MFLVVAGAAFLVLCLVIRRWTQRNSTDLGSMSSQWLADYNAQHP
jgi:hypothetical protein